MNVNSYGERIVQRALPAILIGLITVALAGCTSVIPDADTQPSESEVSASAESDADGRVDEAADGDVSGRLGTITMDTTTYDVVDAVNCEPVQSSDLVDETFSSIAVGQSAEGEEVLFFAYTHEDQSGGVANHIDYQGPEGTWSSFDGNATFTLNGDTLSGASVVVDVDNSQSKMIQFSYTLPGVLVVC